MSRYRQEPLPWWWPGSWHPEDQIIFIFVVVVLAVAVSWRSQNKQKKSANDYADLQYWDSRYKTSRTVKFEWYTEACLDRLIKVFRSYRLGGNKVLDLGCGSSELGEELAVKDFEVMGIDFSPHVIAHMKTTFPKRADFYSVMDAGAMSFKKASFHAILDKGTIDGILHDARNDPRALRKARRTMREVARVLKREGILVSISILNAEKWSLCLEEEQQEEEEDQDPDKQSSQKPPRTLPFAIKESQTWAVMQSDKAISVYLHVCVKTAT